MYVCTLRRRSNTKRAHVGRPSIGDTVRRCNFNIRAPFAELPLSSDLSRVDRHVTDTTKFRQQVIYKNYISSFLKCQKERRIEKAYTTSLLEDFPPTDPQQDLCFFFDPHGHSWFREIFCGTEENNVVTSNKQRDSLKQNR